MSNVGDVKTKTFKQIHVLVCKPQDKIYVGKIFMVAWILVLIQCLIRQYVKQLNGRCHENERQKPVLS